MLFNQLCPVVCDRVFPECEQLGRQPTHSTRLCGCAALDGRSCAAVVCQILYPLLTWFLVFCCDWLQNQLRRCKDSGRWKGKEQLVCKVTSTETAYTETVQGLSYWSPHQRMSVSILGPALHFFNCAKFLALIATEVKIAQIICVWKYYFIFSL